MLPQAVLEVRPCLNPHYSLPNLALEATSNLAKSTPWSPRRMPHMVANWLTETRAEQPDDCQIKEACRRDISIWPHGGGGKNEWQKRLTAIFICLHLWVRRHSFTFSNQKRWSKSESRIWAWKYLWERAKSPPKYKPILSTLELLHLSPNLRK